MLNKILVVDDEESIAYVLRDIFTAKGYEVLVALNGADALKYIDNERFDLVSLDIQMPGINGIEVLKELKKRNSIIKTVVLSGVMDEYKEQVEAIGCDAFLNKPFSVRILISVIESVLKEEKAKDSLLKLVDDISIFGKARLLFIEPNAIMYSSKLAYFSNAQRCKGEYRLMASFTGTDAEDKLKDFKPDLVVSDINMFRLYRIKEKFSHLQEDPKDIILYGMTQIKDKDSGELSFIGGLFDPVTAAVNPKEMDKLGTIVRKTAILNGLYVKREKARL